VLGWLVDNALLFYLLLGLGGVALAAGWWLTRESRYLLGLAVVVLVLFLVWLLTQLVVSDRQRLRQVIEEMAGAVETHKPGLIVKHLAKDFSYAGIARNAIEQKISNAIRDYDLSYVGVWDFDFEHLSRAQGTATVAFRAKVDVGGSRSQFLCRADFVLEDGQWRMKTFNLFNPVTDTKKPLQVPLR
jgi:hypothetical protein